MQRQNLIDHLRELHREGKPATVTVKITHDPKTNPVGRVAQIINSAPQGADISVKGGA